MKIIVPALSLSFAPGMNNWAVLPMEQRRPATPCPPITAWVKDGAFNIFVNPKIEDWRKAVKIPIKTQKNKHNALVTDGSIDDPAINGRAKREQPNIIKEPKTLTEILILSPYLRKR